MNSTKNGAISPYFPSLSNAKKLGQVAVGRDNNLNLIRAIAALAVMVSHAYPIALGTGTAEPLSELLGFSLGFVAVAAFFVISGFLITLSFERASSRTDFMVARVLRLWPGLIVCTLLIAFVLGPLVTSLSPQAYFSHPDTWSFIWRDITLYSVQYHLPGVYDDLPYTSVAGSIWTLIHEFVCYMGVFVLGIIGFLKKPGLMAVLLLAFLGLYMAVEVTQPDLPSKLLNLIHLAMPFALGVALYVWRDRIPLLFVGVIVLALLAWALHGTVFFKPAFTLALAYVVFWIAYIPGGIIRAYNQIGDYSYGLYIYAFPLQGFAVWLFGSMTPLTNLLIAVPMTLFFSILSWHLIEKPSLGVRKNVSRRIRVFFSRSDQID